MTFGKTYYVLAVSLYRDGKRVPDRLRKEMAKRLRECGVKREHGTRLAGQEAWDTIPEDVRQWVTVSEAMPVYF